MLVPAEDKARKVDEPNITSDIYIQFESDLMKFGKHFKRISQE